MTRVSKLVGRVLVVAMMAAVCAGQAGVGAAAAPTPAPTASPAVAATIAPALAARLAALSASDTVAVFATLKARADLSVVRDRDRRVRAKRVQSVLRAFADARQKDVRATLSRLVAAGEASDVRVWWVDNAVSFTGTATAVRQVSALPEVLAVTLDEAAIRPSATGAPTGPPATNVTAVGAPTLWARGITGAAVVVADLDTGVDGTQPDLAGSWRSGAGGWFDPYGQHATPTDVNGHGTWTTSVMVGRDGSGQAVGVAPDAQWIAARVFDDSGRATLSGVHAAFQWVLDPTGNPSAPSPPQVLNASWSSTSTVCSTDFQPDLVAMRAASIVPVFAAGNSGPALNSGTSPATLPEALAVGSVDSTDVIDVSSSRGPSSCSGRSHFPDLVAPGVNIPVDDLYGGSWTASGTSMAAPHVAGALALLLGAHPGLTADQQQAAVTAGAVDLGAVGVDDVYGAGRLDVVTAEASLGTAPPPGPVTSSVGVTPNPVGGSAVPTVTATLTAAAGGGTPVSARASVDGAAVAALSVTAVGGVTSASGALPGAFADGTHTVAVSAADAAGIWGAPSSAAFTVDRTPPLVSNLTVTPSPTAGAATITVSATATDSVTGVRTAEAWLDADPGMGRGTPMSVTSGSAWSVTLPTSGLATGAHSVSVRFLDSVGNAASATSSVTVSALPVTSFADGFESGGLSAWASTGGAGLSVTTTAALSGVYGLAVNASRTGGWARATVPGTTGAFNARILFDPRGLATGSAVVPILVENSTLGPVSGIDYRKVSAGAQIRVSGRTSSGAVKAGSWLGIPTTGTSVLELDGQPSSGTVTLFVANVSKTALTGLTTNRTPTSIDIGLVGAQPSTVTGGIRLDAVVANRSTHIGIATAGL